MQQCPYTQTRTSQNFVVVSSRACGLVGVREEKLGNLVCRARAADVVALYLSAALSSQSVELLFGLDAFGSRRHAEADAELSHRAHQGNGTNICCREIGNEAAID